MSDAFVEQGQNCPEISLMEPVSGNQCSLADYFNNGSTLVYWIKFECPVCCQAAPYVERMAQLLGQGAGEARGGTVLLVAQNQAHELPEFRESHGCPEIPILCEPEPYESSKRLGLSVVPAWFLISEAGVVQRSGMAFSPSELTEIYVALGAEGSLFSEQELAELPALRPG